MSTFSCPIVEITKWGKHSKADTLSITQVFGFNVIFRTSEFIKSETRDDIKSFRAIFIPEESLVPEIPMFKFMWDKRITEGKPIRESDRVVKAIRLREIFSCGLLMPIPREFIDEPTGTDLASQLGITKYEQPEKACTGGDNDAQQEWMIKFTDIENVRRYSDVLIPGEQVWITEKIHGSNARYMYRHKDGHFFVGSHVNIKRHNNSNVWSVVEIGRAHV